MLANHAEVQNGLLYISGGGIDRMTVQGGGPWSAVLAIAGHVRVEWTETNRDVTLAVDLVDEDESPVLLPVSETGAPLHTEAVFNVGRPPGAVQGLPQSVPFAFNFGGAPLPRLGLFNFRISIDGEAVDRLPFSVAAQQDSFGPSSLPSF